MPILTALMFSGLLLQQPQAPQQQPTNEERVLLDLNLCLNTERDLKETILQQRLTIVSQGKELEKLRAELAKKDAPTQ